MTDHDKAPSEPPAALASDAMDAAMRAVRQVSSSGVARDSMEYAIRAYLAALLPPETKGLVERLRSLGDRASFEPSAYHKAAAALEKQAARIAELEERAHYAEGVADLAMKHRDDAEARAKAMGRALRGCACECTDLSDCPDGLQCAGWIAKTALKDDEVIAQRGEQP